MMEERKRNRWLVYAARKHLTGEKKYHIWSITIYFVHL